MNPLQKEIANIQEQLNQLDRVRRYLDELLVRRQQQQGVIDRLYIWAQQELDDVTKLEKNGKNRSNHKNSRFDHESAMEKERREYLVVIRKVKAVEHDLHLLDFEIGVLQEKLDKRPVLQQQLEKLQEQWEEDRLQSSQDVILRKLSTELERSKQKRKRTNEVLEWSQHCLVYMDQIKRRFESMMLLPNWNMVPESKIRLAEDELEHVHDHILEIKKTLNAMNEDWISIARSLPSGAIPSLKRINGQMNELQRQTQGFRQKLKKPSHLNGFLAPAQHLIFKTRSDLEQAIQELQATIRELKELEDQWKREQRERLRTLLEN